MYFITPGPDKLASALEAWSWIGLDGKRPIRVTAFGDVFLQAADGIWFLDTIEGNLEHVSSSDSELDELLATAEGRDRFLLSGLVDRAVREGRTLGEGECYDFKITPVLGGAIAYENMQTQDFEVTLHLVGQIHEQARRIRPGTKIASVTVEDRAPTSSKPWWKAW